jgi:hypothetical protein
MKSDVKTACVTLEDVLVAASIRAASLVPETSGYLTLAVADATNRLPLGIEDRAILLTTEGSVTLARRGPMIAPESAGAAMRDVLARLLNVSAGTMPGLASAARPRGDAERDVEGVVGEIEAALVPVTRAREMGKIAAAIRKSPPPASEPLSKRDLNNTLVGFAPQPDPNPQPSRSVATMPTMVAEASPHHAPSPRSTAVTSVEGARVAPNTPNPVAAVLAQPTEAPAPVEPFIEVVEEPFEPTPTAMGMSVWTVEEAKVAAPAPTPRPTPLETAPWRALDADTLAKLDLDGSTSIDEAAPVVTSAPSLAAMLEPSVPIHVEHLDDEGAGPAASVDEPEPSVAIEVVIEESPAPAPAIEIKEASEASLPMVAAAYLAAIEPTPAPVDEPAVESSESPVLELFVESVPVAHRMTLPWPVFNGEPEPDPGAEDEPSIENFTVPMPAEMIEQAVAASIEESVAIVPPEPEPLEASSAFAEVGTDDIAEVEEIDEATRAAIEAHAQGAAMAGGDPSAVAPYVFELLRRAARVSAPPPLAPAPERTRADDLLERFTREAPNDDKSIRAAASSLKAMVGLDATPPPLMSFTPRPGGRPLDPIAPAGEARPSTTPAFVVPKVQRGRRLAVMVPLFCFALGMLAATAAVSAFRPELVSDVAGRIGKDAAKPAVDSPKSNAAPGEARRAGTRAERDDKPASRSRAGN